MELLRRVDDVSLAQKSTWTSMVQNAESQSAQLTQLRQYAERFNRELVDLTKVQQDLRGALSAEIMRARDALRSDIASALAASRREARLLFAITLLAVAAVAVLQITI